MLTVILRPHREALLAGTDEEQKLFVMLQLIPQEEAARTRPPVALGLMLDASDSMRLYADQEEARCLAVEMIRQDAWKPGPEMKLDQISYQEIHLPLPTKLDKAIDAAKAVIDDPTLLPVDQVTICSFAEGAGTALPLGRLEDRKEAHAALDSLRKKWAGGTRMAVGMEHARRQMAGLPSEIAKRAVLLTDGYAADTEECRAEARAFAKNNTPIVAIGIGEKYNLDLMLDLPRITQGRPYGLKSMDELRKILEEEIRGAVREVVTDLQATVDTVRGVRLDSLTRIYPSLVKIEINRGPKNVYQEPYRLGNAASGDYTVFLLEFTISGLQRPPSRATLARVGMAARVPGLRRHLDLPLQSLTISFTPDEGTPVDTEVMGYVHQRTLEGMVREAMAVAKEDRARAQRLLAAAEQLAGQINTPRALDLIREALEGLRKTGDLNELRNTVTLGMQTVTVRSGGAGSLDGLSDEYLRELTE